MDNLNTHVITSLYKKYPAQEAHCYAKRLEIHYNTQARELAEYCSNRVECNDKTIPCQKIGLCKDTAGINNMGEYEKQKVRESIVAFYNACTKLLSFYPKLESSGE